MKGFIKRLFRRQALRCLEFTFFLRKVTEQTTISTDIKPSRKFQEQKTKNVIYNCKLKTRIPCSYNCSVTSRGKGFQVCIRDLTSYLPVVCVGASAIPVSWDRFGVKSNFDSKVFSNTMQYKPWYPQVVSHINTFTRTNLVFPLKQKRPTVINIYKHSLYRSSRNTLVGLYLLYVSSLTWENSWHLATPSLISS